MREKYYFIYRTTCTTTLKFYVGMHVTSNLQDGYLGSGVLLKKSIAKYGPNAHVREIIEHCASLESLIEREMSHVTADLLRDPLCLNLKVGGSGGFSAEQQQINGQRGNAAMKALYEKRPELLQEKKKKNRESMLQQYAAGTRVNVFAQIQVEMTQRAMSPEARRKRLGTFAERQHQQGTKNSQHGTCWVRRDGSEKKIKIDLLDEYLHDGWERGRAYKRKSSVQRDRTAVQ